MLWPDGAGESAEAGKLGCAGSGAARLSLEGTCQVPHKLKDMKYLGWGRVGREGWEEKKGGCNVEGQ